MSDPAVFVPDELHKALTTHVFDAIDAEVVWMQKAINRPEPIPRDRLVDVYKIWFDAVVSDKGLGPDAQGLVDLADTELRKDHRFVASGHFALNTWFALHPEQKTGVLDDDFDDLRNLKKDMDARWGVEHPDPEIVKQIFKTALTSVWNAHGGIIKKGEVSVGEMQKLAHDLEEEGAHQAAFYKSEYIGSLVRRIAVGSILAGGTIYLVWRGFKSRQAIR